ncbi:Structural maintenance of chromosomes protein 5 [Ceratobasidium sp. 414]|nr:Structural maintenance of chromosomes protein 5 [Ceratobasidium sp. 414]
MLIGANGTGQSSIAGAIAVGLGGSPNILGRQSEIHGFVEIELKGPTGERILVIQRQLATLNKDTEFLLHGKSISYRDFKTRLEELNVQVTNLWHALPLRPSSPSLQLLLSAFLPQDKVSEFANMNSQMMLRETQRAAGNPNLTAWHYSSIENSKELRVAREAGSIQFQVPSSNSFRTCLGPRV